MFLYTIVPLEYIFDTDNDEKEPDEPGRKEPEEVQIKQNGVTVLAQPLPGGQMKITRLVSTNPQHYLQSDWQPGTVIQPFHPF